MTTVRLIAVAGIAGVVALAWRDPGNWSAQLLWTGSVILCIALAARDYVRRP